MSQENGLLLKTQLGLSVLGADYYKSEGVWEHGAIVPDQTLTRELWREF